MRGEIIIEALILTMMMIHVSSVPPAVTDESKVHHATFECKVPKDQKFSHFFRWNRTITGRNVSQTISSGLETFYPNYRTTFDQKNHIYKLIMVNPIESSMMTEEEDDVSFSCFIFQQNGMMTRTIFKKTIKFQLLRLKNFITLGRRSMQQTDLEVVMTRRPSGSPGKENDLPQVVNYNVVTREINFQLKKKLEAKHLKVRLFQPQQLIEYGPRLEANWTCYKYVLVMSTLIDAAFVGLCSNVSQLEEPQCQYVQAEMVGQNLTSTTTTSTTPLSPQNFLIQFSPPPPSSPPPSSSPLSIIDTIADHLTPGIVAGIFLFTGLMMILLILLILMRRSKKNFKCGWVSCDCCCGGVTLLCPYCGWIPPTPPPPSEVYHVKRTDLEIQEEKMEDQKRYQEWLTRWRDRSGYHLIKMREIDGHPSDQPWDTTTMDDEKLDFTLQKGSTEGVQEELAGTSQNLSKTCKDRDETIRADTTMDRWFNTWSTLYHQPLVSQI